VKIAVLRIGRASLELIWAAAHLNVIIHKKEVLLVEDGFKKYSFVHDLRIIHFHLCFTAGFEEDFGETWWQTTHVECTRDNGICKAAY
jgi:hypothetical protein